MRNAILRPGFEIVSGGQNANWDQKSRYECQWWMRSRYPLFPDHRSNIPNAVVGLPKPNRPKLGPCSRLCVTGHQPAIEGGTDAITQRENQLLLTLGRHSNGADLHQRIGCSFAPYERSDSKFLSGPMQEYVVNSSLWT